MIAANALFSWGRANPDASGALNMNARVLSERRSSSARSVLLPRPTLTPLGIRSSAGGDHCSKTAVSTMWFSQKNWHRASEPCHVRHFHGQTDHDHTPVQVRVQMVQKARREK